MNTLDLTILAELEREFTPQVLRNLLQLTLKSADHELGALEAAVQENLHDDIYRIAHKMVGIFGQYGATETFNIAKKIAGTEKEQLLPICKILMQSGHMAITQIRQYQHALKI